MMMKLIKSMVFAVAALSATAAFADDGNEYASIAADKMRLAQELRFKEQNSQKAERYVNSDDKKAEQTTKSEG
ncbi:MULTISPECIES: hypothetical protein [Pseudomonas syringae group]|uniref:Secreted protein n=3 Tax=Pseudomonas cannabina TaxID=86840 RepID=A0A0P9MJD4_PSECA|nr:MULTISPECIES: hypothetical protein [Pseudomonas syringae group]KPW17995.1 Uncharacterized protein ALO83_00545 [Pseudomonas cannabina pv. alisalensis]KPW68883.1 Uncharacterized protein ALO81_03095 [Pseudomonas cannabina]MBM0141431.1 hypothetical protein [Pseudomonas cannabina pv. alisalensis]QQN21716.1 hypothetical protein JGS08_24685 [Pseudomonas cannabina pv. alisalensis]RMN36750.1 hypothetical protein ALQ64_03314 [Pseudomonas cannabina]